MEQGAQEGVVAESRGLAGSPGRSAHQPPTSPAGLTKPGADMKMAVCLIQSSVTFTGKPRRRLSAFTLKANVQDSDSIARTRRRRALSPMLGATRARPSRLSTAGGKACRKDCVRSSSYARNATNGRESGIRAHRSRLTTSPPFGGNAAIAMNGIRGHAWILDFPNRITGRRKTRRQAAGRI
jgi:hypothetical protein